MEDKVLTMYAKGMSQRDIAETIEEIYGFEISPETISTITDYVIDTAKRREREASSRTLSFSAASFI